MGRKAKELGPLAVSRLASPGLHFVGGVAGLAFQVSRRGACGWVLRAQVGDKRRDMGLGGFPDISLAGAREAALAARAKVRDGIDPAANSRALRSAMKADQAHAKTFNLCALAYIDTHEDPGALVFTSPRGGMVSDMSLTAVLRRMKVDAVPHGSRSSFRDWCAERTNYPREVAEITLAHAISDKVEAAYRRGDLFEKRRRLMKDWAAFCANPEIRERQRDFDERRAPLMVSFGVPL